MPASRSSHRSATALAWLAVFAVVSACSSPGQDAGTGGAVAGQTGSAGAGGGGQTTYRFSADATVFSLFHDEQGVTFELVYARE